MNTLGQERATIQEIQTLARIAAQAAEHALGEFKLSSVGALRVLSHEDEFSVSIADAVKKSLRLLSASNVYRDEEVPSAIGYYSGYNIPRRLDKQITMLRGAFPKADFKPTIATLGPLPKGSEGRFVIPRWQCIAPTYNGAVEAVLYAIRQTRGGKKYNFRPGELDPACLRESERKVHFFERLATAQNNNDLLVVPAQFGVAHRGQSVRRVRELLGEEECGLGSYEVSIMLLLHSDRLVDVHDLNIDCAGDEYDLAGQGDFTSVPSFRCYERGFVAFTEGSHSMARPDSGSATCFMYG